MSVSLILKASRLQGPLQVPNEFYQKFSYVEETDKPTHERQTYHAMVDFADQAIGNFTKALKAKGMWDQAIIVFSAVSALVLHSIFRGKICVLAIDLRMRLQDNGGPVYWTETPAYPHGGSANNCELQLPRQSSECALLLSEACGQTR